MAMPEKETQAILMEMRKTHRNEGEKNSLLGMEPDLYPECRSYMQGMAINDYTQVLQDYALRTAGIKLWLLEDCYGTHMMNGILTQTRLERNFSKRKEQINATGVSPVGRLRDLDLIGVPLCVDSNHWVLGMIDFRNTDRTPRIIIVNSIEKEDDGHEIDLRNKWAKCIIDHILMDSDICDEAERHAASRHWGKQTYVPGLAPQQEAPYTDCGIFLCGTIAAKSYGMKVSQTPVSHGHAAHEYRFRLSHDILHKEVRYTLRLEHSGNGNDGTSGSRAYERLLPPRIRENRTGDKVQPSEPTDRKRKIDPPMPPKKRRKHMLGPENDCNQSSSYRDPSRISTMKAITQIVDDMMTTPTHWTNEVPQHPQIQEIISSHMHLVQTLHTHPLEARADTAWRASNPIHSLIGAAQQTTDDFLQNRYTWVGPTTWDRDIEHLANAIKAVNDSTTPTRVALLTMMNTDDRMMMDTRPSPTTRVHTVAIFEPGELPTTSYMKTARNLSNNQTRLYLTVMETQEPVPVDYVSLREKLKILTKGKDRMKNPPPWSRGTGNRNTSQSNRRRPLRDRPSYTWFRHLPIFKGGKYHKADRMDTLQTLQGINKRKLKRHLLHCGHPPDHTTKKNMRKIQNLFLNTTLKAHRRYTRMKMRRKGRGEG
jgi:hypothetical protein